MGHGVRQHLAGIVVNQKVNPSRSDFELLEATLTNCIRFGASSQNRAALPDFRAHLEGRVGFIEMINRLKGHRLRTLFESIPWS